MQSSFSELTSMGVNKGVARSVATIGASPLVDAPLAVTRLDPTPRSDFGAPVAQHTVKHNLDTGAEATALGRTPGAVATEVSGVSTP
jgi:hypothetical protein